MNKKIMMYGGVALVGAYLLTRSSDSDVSFGGGGGGLPVLGEVVEGESDSSVGQGLAGLTTSAPAWDTATSKKVDSVFKKYEVAYKPAQIAYDKSIAAGAPTSQDVSRYGASKKTHTKYSRVDEPNGDKSKEGAPWYNPFAWDLGEAIENYEAFNKESWDRSLNRPEQLHGAVKAKKTISSRSIISRQSVDKVKRTSSSGGIVYDSPAGPPSPNSSSKKKYRDGRGGYTSSPGSPD